MTLAEKHGFTFASVPADNPIVGIFQRAHLEAHGLPDDARSMADHWVAVCKPPGVYALFGWRLLDDAGGVRVDVSDFYCAPGRLGTLAAYAALERIRTLSDQRGVPVLTATPAWNTRMIAAIRRMFGVSEPSHVVHIHVPEASQKVEVA
jgi:hypothetical protein